jgi:hypothetical protein
LKNWWRFGKIIFILKKYGCFDKKLVWEKWGRFDLHV